MSHDYRTLDILSMKIYLKTFFLKNKSFIIERPNSNDDEDKDSFTYLAYDTKDRFKTRYILKIVDLEKMNNISEFIVCNK